MLQAQKLEYKRFFETSMTKFLKELSDLLTQHLSSHYCEDIPKFKCGWKHPEGWEHNGRC